MITERQSVTEIIIATIDSGNWMNRFALAAFIFIGCVSCHKSICLGAPQQESLSDREQTVLDFLRQMQLTAIETEKANWIHWGDRKDKFSNWTTHSNRLIPVYAFGVELKNFSKKNSPFRSADRLESIFGYEPVNTFNPSANYFDQTDIYRIQKEAFAAGKRNVILFVCDGMDWQITQAASIYKNKKVTYQKGRGKGLGFLDYKAPKQSDYGYMVTSPYSRDTKVDVNSQTITSLGEPAGGYIVQLGGKHPWSQPADVGYLLGKSASQGHAYTDSAASATSMTTGRKTYNGSINVSPDGEQAETIAHQMQAKGYAIGVVTSVPICHATPGACYAHNVDRNDYQDISRDMLGLPSIAHRKNPLQGVDVLIGCGWGEKTKTDEKQGDNFSPGNKYLANDDLDRIDVDNGGNYFVVKRHAGESGSVLLADAAILAATDGNKLFGFFGGPGGHLPFRTANGDYNPTRGIKGIDVYKPNDITENPTLAEMTTAALEVLSGRSKPDAGFWLMVESGDIDWALHNNNIDDAIGAVFDADDAFMAITKWVEENSSWDETALIMTADHGHMMILDKAKALTGKLKVRSSTNKEN